MMLIRLLIMAGIKRKRDALKAFFKNLSHVYSVTFINDSDSERAVEIITETQPDIILYVEDDEDEALRTLSTVKSVCLNTEIVLLSEKNGVDFSLKALKSGADCCLPSMSLSCLSRLLEVISRSNIMILPKSARNSIITTMEDCCSHEKDSLFTVKAGLTAREKEIFPLLIKNLPNKVIAKELFIAESTVKTHVSNILHKMGVKTRDSLNYIIND